MKSDRFTDTIPVTASLHPGGYPTTTGGRALDPIISVNDMTTRTEAVRAFALDVSRYSFAILTELPSPGCQMLVYRHLDDGTSEARTRKELNAFFLLSADRDAQVANTLDVWARLRPHWQELRRREKALEKLKKRYFSRARAGG